jgi:TolB-like protein/Flp pilus assembly protein TadD
MPDEKPQDRPEAPPSAPEHGVPGHSHAHPHLPTFRFIEELKRRNVGRVAVLYIIVSYLILEVFGVFVHLLELPAWIGRSVVLLVVLGFPVALLIAWIYEITPEGLRPTEDVAPHQSIRHQTGKRLDRAIIAVLAVALTYFVLDKFWLSKRATPVAAPVATAVKATPAAATIPDKSIAVLPFVDMSEKHDQEYFADGMAEEILDVLAKIPGLKVIGRTSSFSFKGKNEDLRAIGAKLSAAYVLEGSVRKSAGQVRITTQLINTHTGTHEWSETYDRPIGEVLKLQDSIAGAVARELQLTVAPDYVSARSIPQDLEIYDLYLRGRHAYDRHDREGLDEAATLFQRALDRDPTFADAAVWIAWTRSTQAQVTSLPPAAAYEQARRAAATALVLDPNSAAAHAVLGNIYIVYDWDWDAAERELQKVEALAPGSVDSFYGGAKLSLALGRWGDALREINASMAQDPLDPYVLLKLLLLQARLGHVTEAETAARRLLDIHPTFAWAHYYLGLVLLARGDRDGALLAIQQETFDQARQQGLPIIYYALGRFADSDAALAELLRDQSDSNAVGIADVYALRGQFNEAMHWLQKAYSQRDPELWFIKGEIELKTLNKDPRFKAFLRKMNLPE